MTALLALAAPAQATFPGANGRIAFERGNDIWTMNPDGTDQVHLPNNATPPGWPCPGPPYEKGARWSADGSKFALQGSNEGCKVSIYVMNADGSGLTPLVGPTPEFAPAWSPDDSQIAFQAQNNSYYVMNADGSNRTYLPTEPGFPGTLDWSPDGQLIADSHSCGNGYQYGSYIAVMQPFPGGARRPLTNPTLCTSRNQVFPNYDELPRWSPDSQRILFMRDHTLYSINRDGTGLVSLRSGLSAGGHTVWSPDGTKIAFTWVTQDPSGAVHINVGVMNADGSNATLMAMDAFVDDWQPIPVNNYVRPKGATPFKTFLVPAYKACATPDRTHGAPLSFGSCSAPQQTSSYLTVGTPDSNGLAASARGFMQYTTIVGNPSTPANEADVQIEVSIVGVLNKSDRSPYSGELSADAGLRITDKLNSPSPGGPGAATVQDSSFPVTVPCASSSCSVSTTANALVPGAVLEGKRAIWQLGQVKVYDGGSDGLASTTADNTLFMDQGVFVP
jgi:dipeptidyl aminopeptidase/acylaminoacyl peptidase